MADQELYDFYDQQKRQLMNQNAVNNAFAKYGVDVRQEDSRPWLSAGVGALIGGLAGGASGNGFNDVLSGMAIGGGLGLGESFKTRSKNKEAQDKINLEKAKQELDWIARQPAMLNSLLESGVKIGNDQGFRNIFEASGMGNYMPAQGLVDDKFANFSKTIQGNKQAADYTERMYEKSRQGEIDAYNYFRNNGKPALQGTNNVNNTVNKGGVLQGGVDNDLPFSMIDSSDIISVNQNIAGNRHGYAQLGVDEENKRLNRQESSYHNRVTEGQGQQKTNAYVSRQKVLNKQTAINIDKILNPQNYDKPPSREELNESVTLMQSTLQQSKYKPDAAYMHADYVAKRAFMNPKNKLKVRAEIKRRTGVDPEMSVGLLKSNFTIKKDKHSGYSPSGMAEEPPME